MSIDLSGLSAKELGALIKNAKKQQTIVAKRPAVTKVRAQLTKLAKARLPYISVLTDPTMGGVSAGFAFMGDVVIGEPKALIGFAGPRVIENTVRVKLPEGFQRAEFLQTKGAVDFICDRRELRATVANLLAMLQRQSADAVVED